MHEENYITQFKTYLQKQLGTVSTNTFTYTYLLLYTTQSVSNTWALYTSVNSKIDQTQVVHVYCFIEKIII